MSLSLRAFAAAAALSVTVVVAAGCYDPGDLGDAPFKCTPDYPQCPDKYVCDGQNCVRGSGKMNVSITKSGAYTGPHEQNPMANGNTCPETDANASIGAAIPISDNAPLERLAICPGGDVDYFHGTSDGSYVKVTIKYLVKYGDLDVGLLDKNGKLRETDGSATDNGCVVSASGVSGDFYIVVKGAAASDVNTYTVQMNLSQSRPSCSG